MVRRAPHLALAPPPPLAEEEPPIGVALPADILAAEVDALPSEQTLHEHGPFAVLFFHAHQAPSLMWELGRLRELTFRAAGEGTGKPVDLDRYDEWYVQLVVWHREARTIVGAYRLGPTDAIFDDHGVGGLYTRSLWSYDDRFVDLMGPALELGRSFVRMEQQRSPVALPLLWRGIGAFLVRNPRYRCLFGPVSIDRRYADRSIQRMVGHLLAKHRARGFEGLVEATTPLELDTALCAEGASLDTRALGASIAEEEPDGRGLPVLVRQYLKLGAEVLSFNVDPDFSDVVDALIVVDLDRAEERRLRRFMGEDALSAWRARRGAQPPAVAVRSA